MKILWKMQSCQTGCLLFTEENTAWLQGSQELSKIFHTQAGLCALHVWPKSEQIFRQILYTSNPTTFSHPKVTKCQKQRCVHYYAFLLNLLEDNPGLMNKMTMSDEAYFHLIATVKRENFCYQSTENPCELYQWPMHRRKVTMFYTVSLLRTSYTFPGTAG
jgi:hypothetical protein